MEWTNRDTELTLNGIGSLANAWGAYETGKERNKIAREALQYEKDQKAAADLRRETTQTGFDDAFNDVFTKKKKKKKDDGTEVATTETDTSTVDLR